MYLLAVPVTRFQAGIDIGDSSGRSADDTLSFHGPGNSRRSRGTASPALAQVAGKPEQSADCREAALRISADRRRDRVDEIRRSAAPEIPGDAQQTDRRGIRRVDLRDVAAVGYSTGWKYPGTRRERGTQWWTTAVGWTPRGSRPSACGGRTRDLHPS